MEFDPRRHPHRRLNVLTGEWVLVSPQRTQRPWLGAREKVPPVRRPAYDPQCYLCPGNSRAGGVRNPSYTGTFVFDNDFPALRADTPRGWKQGDSLVQARSERGICRVVCFSPRHDLDLATMDPEAIVPVVATWTEQFTELGTVDWIRYVQIFENRGEMMGCSNPHPHCQIWASESLPNQPARETEHQHRYLKEQGRCLLCRYTELELAAGERLVFADDAFVVVVPYWAVWPFEVLVIARRHCGSLEELAESERRSLAATLHRLAVRYDNLFETAFPYSMGFHQRPTDGVEHPEWHLHLHFYPPLLRSATVRKFMVGYEMLATPQRDITPEAAAARLRSMSEVHFTRRELGKELEAGSEASGPGN